MEGLEFKRGNNYNFNMKKVVARKLGVIAVLI